ncbi:hypothetical protein Tco_0572706 [Tanacetum coccineum]
MIKEHDQHAKMKATLRKLSYVDSDKEAPARRKQGEKGPNLEEKGPDTKRQAQTPNMRKIQNMLDLNSPYKRPKPTPFTQRITRFKYHRRAKLPQNIRVYEGNKDPKDHFGIFSAAAEQEEWLMPIWCKMFRQILRGAAHNWVVDWTSDERVDSF